MFEAYFGNVALFGSRGGSKMLLMVIPGSCNGLWESSVDNGVGFSRSGMAADTT